MADLSSITLPGPAALPELAGFAAASLAITFSPGPSTIAMTATGSAFGLARALPYALGSALGTISVMAAVAAGLASLLLAEPAVATILLIISAGYILYLALRIATAPPPGLPQAGSRPPGPAGGVVLAVTNPKAWLAFAALFAGTGTTPGEIGPRMLILAGSIIASHVVWLLLGAGFARLLRRPRVSRTVNLVLAVLLVGSMVVAVRG
ncbi:LysE family transporter [Tistrella mobilis]|uniref:LysE family translocator n=1 Tax=Tistrella mobilis TaxID=171437 RepID=UPI00355679EB